VGDWIGASPGSALVQDIVARADGRAPLVRPANHEGIAMELTRNAQHELPTAAPSWLRRHVCDPLCRLEHVAAERRGRLHLLEAIALPADVAASAEAAARPDAAPAGLGTAPIAPGYPAA
jgi:hypothetical protein